MSKFLPSRRELNIMLENGQITSAEYRRMRKMITKRAQAGGSAGASLTVTSSFDILSVPDEWLSASTIFTEWFMSGAVKDFGTPMFITAENAAGESVGFAVVILADPQTTNGKRLISSGTYGDTVLGKVRENALTDADGISRLIHSTIAGVVENHRMLVREQLWTDVMTGEDGGASFDILAPRNDNPDGDSEMARI